ncbi:MAG: recombinase family protein [Planctomycetes bacterium]|nr:recombinase family protein [Planctomycetota bacterium]
MKRPRPPAEPTRLTTRCAIYTRKSTEEGLDQDFNTLDAQREAAEAYIASQRGEGWEVVRDRYDDGGFSGGNMERPALQRLLADIEAGRVNAVVVYKVDRLSRSLLDFARIMEVLDQRKVAFVSVTQQFNTATSMGRLILHVLLSFAQFEREMIAERTRDKMSAARRKGKWTGGMPFLGYDVAPDGGKLLVNEEEARRVRGIFDLYLREQSLVSTAAELHRRGWTLKAWTTKKGTFHAGSRFDKANLFSLLTNVAYTGQVSHKGTIYPGEHPAIVDPEVWRRAQELLRHNGQTGGRAVRNKHGALLKELLRCAPCDAAMGHAYTVKGGRRYRYYVCQKAQKRGWASCPTKSVPAAEVERFVIDRIRAIGRDRDLLDATLAAAREEMKAAVGRIEEERAAEERRLATLRAEARRLMKAGDGSSARLADLHDQVRAAEQGLTALRERAIAAEKERVDEEDLERALSLFDPVWDALFPKEQARILRLLVERVAYDGGAGSIAVTFRPNGIQALAREVEAGPAESRR